jgi:L-alanine-DL-glutamate epimerase-like enolase superfamily enzyme
MNRRTFLHLPFTVALAPLIAQRVVSAPGPLRITDIRLIRLREIREVGWMEPAWSPGSRVRYAVGGGAVVEILTDQGISGIGPDVPESYLPAVREMLAGQDPFDTERLNHKLARYARGSAYRGMGCLDVALWDLVGKACGQPLHKLFGGGRSKVTAYASMVQLSAPEERGRLAGKLADDGWKALKLRLHHPTMKEDLRTVEEVRKAVGDRMVLLTDANQAQSSSHD